MCSCNRFSNILLLKKLYFNSFLLVTLAISHRFYFRAGDTLSYRLYYYYILTCHKIVIYSVQNFPPSLKVCGCYILSYFLFTSETIYFIGY